MSDNVNIQKKSVLEYFKEKQIDSVTTLVPQSIGVVAVDYYQNDAGYDPYVNVSYSNNLCRDIFQVKNNTLQPLQVGYNLGTFSTDSSAGRKINSRARIMSYWAETYPILTEIRTDGGQTEQSSIFLQTRTGARHDYGLINSFQLRLQGDEIYTRYVSCADKIPTSGWDEDEPSDWSRKYLCEYSGYTQTSWNDAVTGYNSTYQKWNYSYNLANFETNICYAYIYNADTKLLSLTTSSSSADILAALNLHYITDGDNKSSSSSAESDASTVETIFSKASQSGRYLYDSANDTVIKPIYYNNSKSWELEWIHRNKIYDTGENLHFFPCVCKLRLSFSNNQWSVFSPVKLCDLYGAGDYVSFYSWSYFGSLTSSSSTTDVVNAFKPYFYGIEPYATLYKNAAQIYNYLYNAYKNNYTVRERETNQMVNVAMPDTSTFVLYGTTMETAANSDGTYYGANAYMNKITIRYKYENGGAYLSIPANGVYKKVPYTNF